MTVHSHTFFTTIVRALWRDHRNSRRAIEAYRDRSLRALIRHAHEHVPFQRPRLTEVDPQNVRLEAIPPTDKTAMMAAFDETIADRGLTLDEVLQTEADPHRLELPIIRGKYIAVKTSGTSGKPSWLVSGLKDWDILNGATFARMTRKWLPGRTFTFSALRPMRIAVLAAPHAHSMTWQSARSAEISTRPFACVRFVSVIDAVERIMDRLNAFRPDYLHAYPTAAEMLARYRLDGGKFAFEPQLISVGSEALTGMAREAIRRAFPVTQLVDHYGMSECLPLSTECRLGKKHINTDYAILEALDAHGRPVGPGELSDHVLVTNLINRTQPIIRYRVDDSVRIFDERCPCGSVFPVVEVVSRKGSLIHLKSERGSWQVLSPPIVVDTMLHAHGVAQYQVVHVRQNELEVKFLPLKGADPQDVAQLISQQFAHVMSRLDCTRSVTVSVERVDGFERTGVGGKLQQTYSLVSPPA